MANMADATGEEVDQLIEDVRKMMRELGQAAESGKDAAGRLQARRWLDVLRRFADYASESLR